MRLLRVIGDFFRALITETPPLAPLTIVPVGPKAGGGRARRQVAPEGYPYRAYTRQFDVEVAAADLDTVLGAPDADFDDAVALFESSLTAWRMSASLAGLAATQRLRAAVDRTVLEDTVVSLLVDHSGSMRGQNILMAAAAVQVAADFLSGLGVRVEVLGFTTVGWKGGKSRALWVKRGSSLSPGRLNDLLHVVYRTADDEAPGAPWNIRQMLRPDLLHENIDGEAVGWAESRLLLQPAGQKLLVVLSDGAPVDDSTLMQNYGAFLEQHLRATITAIEAEGRVRLSAVGIGHAVDRYYRHSIAVTDPGDLGEALIGHLEAELAAVSDR